MEMLKVKNVLIATQNCDTENYQKFKEIVQQKNMNVVDVVATNSCPQKLNIENNLYLEFLWPNDENAILENELNNNSIVCKLNYKNFSMLFTGDIEKIAEEKILQEYKKNLKVLNSTIIKVAHHGSNTSSTEEFINAVKPKVALIGVGENNKFGHPNNIIVNELEKRNIKIYRTDTMGEIEIIVNNKGKIKIKRLKKEK